MKLHLQLIPWLLKAFINRMPGSIKKTENNKVPAQDAFKSRIFDSHGFI